MKNRIKKSDDARQNTGTKEVIIKVLSVVFSLYHLAYMSGLLSMVGIHIYVVSHRAVSLMLMLTLVYLLVPASKSSSHKSVPWYDVLAVVLSIIVNLYIIVNITDIQREAWTASTLQNVLGLITIFLVLEATRRSVGILLSLIGLAFLIYPFVNIYLPGFLQGRGYDLSRLIEVVYLYPQGIYGTVLHIFSTVIIVFLIFGAFLQVSGAGRFFTNISLALMGQYRGGAAKVSILASAFFGSLNGSALANVAGTGSITIPLMKSIGYKSHFAAAVEAVSSTGGPLMPPVMGAIVFIMADFLEMDYVTIMIAALLPAILYFVSVFVMVDLEAARTGITGLDREDLPQLKQTIREGWIYLVPFVALIVFLLGFRYSAQTSCIYATGLLVLVSWFRKDSRIDHRKLVDGLVLGVRGVPQIGTAAGVAGMLTATLAITGVDGKIAGGLVTLAGGNLPILLIFAAVLSIILGMGLPATGTYIITAILMAPALVMVGVMPIVAHLFVFYFGTSAMITPPICMAAFVAASIADSPMMRTGFEAMRIAVVVFIIPFMFIYSPELILRGNMGNIILAVVTALAGTLLLCSGMQGYFLNKAGWGERVLFVIAGLAMVAPGLLTDIAGLGLGSLPILFQLTKNRRPPRIAV